MIFWIVFGALAGWIASLIAGTNQRQGCLMNIVVGWLALLLEGHCIASLLAPISVLALILQA